MTVANMQAILPDQDSLGRPGLAADHEVVIGEVELFRGERHQWEIDLSRLSRPWEMLDERRCHPVSCNEIGKLAAIDQVCEDIRAREHLAERFDHLLATAP